MKYSKFLFSATLLVILSLGMTSCDQKSNSKTDTTEEVSEPAPPSESTNVNESKEGKEHNSAYVCPMHCKGSGSHEAGVCPVCGMDYVQNEDHKKDGHKHEEDHDSHAGHNH